MSHKKYLKQKMEHPMQHIRTHSARAHTHTHTVCI